MVVYALSEADKVIRSDGYVPLAHNRESPGHCYRTPVCMWFRYWPNLIDLSFWQRMKNTLKGVRARNRREWLCMPNQCLPLCATNRPGCSLVASRGWIQPTGVRPHKAVTSSVLWFCIVCSCFNVLMFHVQSSIQLLYAINHFQFITFRVRHSRREMYIGHGPLCVCLSVCLSLGAFLHYCTDPDVTWEMV